MRKGNAMRVLTLILALGVLGQAACTGQAAIEEVATGEAAPLLREALADAQARAEDVQALAFTRTIASANGGDLSARFDPQRPQGEQWALLSPESPDERVQETFDSLQQEDDPLGDVVISDPERFLYGSLDVVREDDAMVVYAAEPRIEDERQRRMAPYLDAEITVDKTTGRFVAYRVFAREPFEPTIASTITKFSMSFDVAEAWPGGPLVTTRAQTEIEGNAFFRSFAETTVTTHTDFEPIAEES